MQGFDLRVSKNKTYQVEHLIESVQILPNGLYTTDNDKDVSIWNFSTGKKIKDFVGVSSITSYKFSNDGKSLAVGYIDNSITLFDTVSGQSLNGFTTTIAPFGIISFSPDGKILLTTNENGVQLWDLISSQPAKTVDIAAHNIKKLIFSHDSKKLIGFSNEYIDIWDLNTLKKTFFLKDFKYKKYSSNAVAISSDNTKLASVDTDYQSYYSNLSRNVNIWHWSNVDINCITCEGKTLVTLPEAEGIYRLIFSPDNKILAIQNFDSTLRYWDIQSGQELKYEQTPAWVVMNYGMQTKINGREIYADDNVGGTIEFYDQSRKEIARLVPINKTDWIVTTPEGFFDGTPNAWKQIIWRFSNNTFDYGAVELYFNEFFYPNLLQDVLAGKSPKPKAGQELEKIDRRQPKVEIAAINGKAKNEINALTTNQFITDKRTATVTIEVADNTDKKKQPNHQETSGAQDLRLFRNGALVKVWRGDVFGKENDCEKIPTKAGEPRRVRCAVEVPVVAGANDFSAYAFNSQNVKSNDDAVSVKGADALKRSGTLYVLAIGVNEYADKKYNLNFAVPDVVDIGKAVGAGQNKLRADAKLKQYAKTEIITLKDETATKENILLALKRFAKDGATANLPENLCAKLKENLCNELKIEFAKIKLTEPEDALLIYYAGHGTSREQRFFLLPHNFTNANELEKQAVSDLELNEYLERVDAGKLLMVIDACQSGQALGGRDEGRAPMNSKGLAQLAYDKGMLILTAAQSRQAALEAVRIGDKEIKHGLLTFSLLEALTNREADKDANSQLWEREWLDYAVGQVPLMQREAMKQRNAEIQKTGRGSELVYLNGDNKNAKPEDRAVQTPRVFYRRETETNPLIVAKP